MEESGNEVPRWRSDTDPAVAGFDAERLERLSRRYADGVRTGEIPGAVVVVLRDGKPVHEEAIGFSDRAAGEAMTVDTVFWLASSERI